MLSYKADSVDKDLAAARERLTGDFKDAYTELTRQVVIPLKESTFTAVAKVVAAAPVSVAANHAVVFLFVNQHRDDRGRRSDGHPTGHSGGVGQRQRPMAGFTFRPVSDGVVMIGWIRVPPAAMLLAGPVLAAPTAHADRTAQQRRRLRRLHVAAPAGCTNDVIRATRSTPAAQWHADDMINNRNINDDTGSDGSTPQDRANAAAVRAKRPRPWRSTRPWPSAAWNWSTSGTTTPMTWRSSGTAPTPPWGCASDNTLDRTVVVAMYGQPAHAIDDTAGKKVPDDDVHAAIPRPFIASVLDNVPSMDLVETRPIDHRSARRIARPGPPAATGGCPRPG